MSAGADYTDGAMIALFIPPELAAGVALPDGLPESELHITLGYFGDASEITSAQRQGLADALTATCTAQTEPLAGTFPGGQGEFTPAEDGDDRPLWVHPDVPALSTFRERLVRELEARDVRGLLHEDHSFSPHVTLSYLAPDEPTPRLQLTPEPITFTAVYLVLGEDKTRVSLPVAAAQSVVAAGPRRARPIPADVDRALSRMACEHNARVPTVDRVRLPVLRAVFARGLESYSLNACPGKTRDGYAFQRVDDFLNSIAVSHASRYAQDLVDADLLPHRRPARVSRPSMYTATAITAAAGADDLTRLLTRVAAFSPADPRRRFAVSRALASARAGGPATAFCVESIEALLADGNSRVARSLRAKRQLRDRFGKFIEMGGGIRFKIRAPGAPGGGRWYHGVAVGVDVPNGLVQVKLDDESGGNTVSVPAAKVEKVKARLGQAPVADAEDPTDAPDIAPAELRGVSQPSVDFGPEVTPAEVTAALQDAQTQAVARLTADDGDARRTLAQLASDAADVPRGGLPPDAGEMLREIADNARGSDNSVIKSWADDVGDIAVAIDVSRVQTDGADDEMLNDAISTVKSAITDDSPVSEARDAFVARLQAVLDGVRNGDVDVDQARADLQEIVADVDTVASRDDNLPAADKAALETLSDAVDSAEQALPDAPAAAQVAAEPLAPVRLNEIARSFNTALEAVPDDDGLTDDAAGELRTEAKYLRNLMANIPIQLADGRIDENEAVVWLQEAALQVDQLFNSYELDPSVSDPLDEAKSAIDAVLVDLLDVPEADAARALPDESVEPDPIDESPAPDPSVQDQFGSAVPAGFQLAQDTVIGNNRTQRYRNDELGATVTVTTTLGLAADPVDQRPVRDGDPVYLLRTDAAGLVDAYRNWDNLMTVAQPAAPTPVEQADWRRSRDDLRVPLTELGFSADEIARVQSQATRRGVEFEIFGDQRYRDSVAAANNAVRKQGQGETPTAAELEAVTTQGRLADALSTQRDAPNAPNAPADAAPAAVDVSEFLRNTALDSRADADALRGLIDGSVRPDTLPDDQRARIADAVQRRIDGDRGRDLSPEEQAAAVKFVSDLQAANPWGADPVAPGRDATPPLPEPSLPAPAPAPTPFDLAVPELDQSPEFDENGTPIASQNMLDDFINAYARADLVSDRNDPAMLEADDNVQAALVELASAISQHEYDTAILTVDDVIAPLQDLAEAADRGDDFQRMDRYLVAFKKQLEIDIQAYLGESAPATSPGDQPPVDGTLPPGPKTPFPDFVPPEPAAPPQPAGAQGDAVRRYVPEGVIKDADRNDLYAGLRVRGADGAAGVIVAVQQEPAYARIRLDDGRQVVRAGRRLNLQGEPAPRPAQQPAPAAPAAPEQPTGRPIAIDGDAPQAAVVVGEWQAWQQPEMPGARAPGARASTPGVQENLDAMRQGPGRGNGIAGASITDYKAWGDRAGEIFNAAQNRPSLDYLKSTGANGDRQAGAEAVAAVFGAGGNTVFGDGFTLNMISGSTSANGQGVASMTIVKDGRNVGRLERAISSDARGGLYAYNAYMKFNTGESGGGFAAAYNRHMENWYIANGIPKVKVEAAGGPGWTGAYVWAVNGFDWDRPAEMQNMVSTMRQRARQEPDGVKDQVNALAARVSAGEKPTPFEFAMLGWTPGATTWFGRDAMKSQTWHGVKSLKPNSRSVLTARDNEKFLAARARANRVDNAVAAPRTVELLRSGEFSDSQGGLAPHLDAITTALTDRQSLAVLPPAAKRTLRDAVNKEQLSLVANRRDTDRAYGEELVALNRALQSEFRLDHPDVIGLGAAGEQLKVIPFADIYSLDRAGAHPDWKFKRIGRAGGVNADGTFVATHTSTGQVFYVKRDQYGSDARRNANGPRDQEIDAANLFRNAGMYGVANVAPAEDGIVIQQRAGDALQLQARPVAAGELLHGAWHPSPTNLANVEDGVRMFVGDMLIGNSDRHAANYQVGVDDQGKWWLFPIDNSLSGRNNGGRFGWWRLANQLDNDTSHGRAPEEAVSTMETLLTGGNTAWYSDFMEDLIGQVGADQARRLMQSTLKDFGTSLASGTYKDEFKTRLQFALELMGRDDVLDAVMQRLRNGNGRNGRGRWA